MPILAPEILVGVAGTLVDNTAIVGASGTKGNDMSKKSDVGRRGFVAAGLVGLGGIGGWLARRFQGPDQVRKPIPTARDSRYVYDISEFETTAPEHLLYDPGEQIPTGFKRAKRLETAPGNRFLVAGDRSVKIFNADGTVESEVLHDSTPRSLLVTGDDEIFVGSPGEFVVYDFDGVEKWRSPSFPEGTYLTSMAAAEGALYLADMKTREILMCDRKSGRIVNRFGRKESSGHNPGFSVPSPYFDLKAAADGQLRIANPGRLRVETYSLDGHFQSSWGGPGMKIDRFCGCCNPVYFTMMPDGSCITSEKGLARVNIYSPEGVFKGAVAGPETLVDDKALAKRACADCRIGAGFDVALEESGRVLVLDPFRMAVRTFTPKETTQVST